MKRFPPAHRLTTGEPEGRAGESTYSSEVWRWASEELLYELGELSPLPALVLWPFEVLVLELVGDAVAGWGRWGEWCETPASGDGLFMRWGWRI